MINQEVVESTVDIKGVSHWYCTAENVDDNFLVGMQSSIVDPDISNFESYWKGFVSKFGVNAALIDYIQQHVRYYLIRENVELSSNQVKKIIENGDGFVLVEYETERDDVFTIEIPSRKIKLQTSKKLLSRESKVFERMLNSEMIEARTNTMTVDHSNFHFELMIDFINIGFVGTDKLTFESNSQSNIQTTDLLELLQLADEYQVESLTGAIGKVCNVYNALTISLAAIELSQDCKSVIYEQTVPIISSQPACVICDPIYRKVEFTELEDSVDYFKIHDKKLFETTILQKAPWLKDISLMRTFALSRSAHNKVIGRLPFELIKLILLNLISNNDLMSTLEFLSFWLITDYESRYETACKFLIENIDPFYVNDDIMFTIFSVFINGKEDQHDSSKNQLKDILLKSLLLKKGYPRELLKLEEIKPSSELIKTPKKTINKKGIFVGQEYSGKTTFLYKWKIDETVLTVPTTDVITETINYKNIDFTIRDIGGSTDLWKNYTQETDFIVFFIISAVSSPEEMQKQKEFLWKVHEAYPKNIPMIVYCNRQDIPNASSIATLTADLNLNGMTDRKWHAQSGVAFLGNGMYESIDYVTSFFLPGKINFFGEIQNTIPEL